MSKLGSWSSLCFPKLPKPECQVFSACSENPLEVSTCPLHCVPGTQTPQKGHLSQLQLLLKLSFKGRQLPNMVQVDNSGTLPLGLSTGNLASALGSRRGLGRSDWPLGHSSHRNKTVNVFRWDCAHSFSWLTTQENVGCYSGKNRLPVPCPYEGDAQRLLEEALKLGTWDFS